LNILKSISSIVLTLAINFNPLIASNLIEADHSEEVPSLLCQLPNELKAHIFSYLEAKKGFIQVSHANKNLRDLALSVDKSIELSYRPLTAEDCQALRQAPFSSIILHHCHLNKEDMAVFFQSSGINELVREINLKDISALDADKFRPITKLYLSHNILTFINLNYLAATNISNLRSLTFRNNHLGVEEEGVKHLSRAHLSALTSLNSGLNNMKDKGLDLIVQTKFPALTSLNLSSNNMGDEALELIVQTEFPALTSLNLSSNDITAVGLNALVKAPFISNLTSLDLSSNKIGEEGLRELAKAPLLALTSLQLEFNNVTERGLRYLTVAPFISNLT
jgi:hypothetical protein